MCIASNQHALAFFTQREAKRDCFVVVFLILKSKAYVSSVFSDFSVNFNHGKHTKKPHKNLVKHIFVGVIVLSYIKYFLNHLSQFVFLCML